MRYGDVNFKRLEVSWSEELLIYITYFLLLIQPGCVLFVCAG